MVSRVVAAPCGTGLLFGLIRFRAGVGVGVSVESEPVGLVGQGSGDVIVEWRVSVVIVMLLSLAS